MGRRPEARIDRATFARLERFCQSLPEASVEPWYDHFNLRVRGKTFAWQTNDHHGDGRVAIHCKAEPGVQQTLVELDPERFFVPPYVGPSGWIGVRLDRSIDWKGLEGLLLEAYRLVAPKKLAAQLSGAPAEADRSKKRVAAPRRRK